MRMSCLVKALIGAITNVEGTTSIPGDISAIRLKPNVIDGADGYESLESPHVFVVV